MMSLIKPSTVTTITDSFPAIVFEQPSSFHPGHLAGEKHGTRISEKSCIIHSPWIKTCNKLSFTLKNLSVSWTSINWQLVLIHHTTRHEPYVMTIRHDPSHHTWQLVLIHHTIHHWYVWIFFTKRTSFMKEGLKWTSLSHYQQWTLVRESTE